MCVCVCVCVCMCLFGSNRLHPNCSAGDRLELFLCLWGNCPRPMSLAHIAGWEFALQRCTGVVGMDIDIEGDTGGASQAKELMDGVARQIKSGAFTSMKELRIGWRFWIGCDAQITSHMALANTAAACHSLKVRAQRSGFCIHARWRSAVQAIIA